MFPLDVSRAHRAGSGPLVVPARIARIGNQTYENHVEHRPAAEVFHVDAMRSFEGVPLTVTHRGWVERSNLDAWAIGYIRNVRRDGIFVAAELVVFDEKVIAQLLDGAFPELSAGYAVDLDETPGTYDGEHYDAIQRNVRGNHVALVPSGRAGPEVRVY